MKVTNEQAQGYKATCMHASDCTVGKLYWADRGADKRPQNLRLCTSDGMLDLHTGFVVASPSSTYCYYTEVAKGERFIIENE